MQQQSEDWTLYYYDLAGRGQFVRVLFDYTKTEFKEICDKEILSKKVYSKGKNESKGWPTYNVPLIEHGNMSIGGKYACVKYVASKLGLVPKNEQDLFHAEQIFCDIIDITNQMHSPKSVSERLNYVNGRLSKHLEVFSFALDKNDYFFGNKCCYVDLTLCVLLETLAQRFGIEKFSQFIGKKYPNLENLRIRCSQFEGVKRLVKRNKKLYGEQWKFE